MSYHWQPTSEERWQTSPMSNVNYVNVKGSRDTCNTLPVKRIKSVHSHDARARAPYTTYWATRYSARSTRPLTVLQYTQHDKSSPRRPAEKWWGLHDWLQFCDVSRASEATRRAVDRGAAGVGLTEIKTARSAVKLLLVPINGNFCWRQSCFFFFKLGSPRQLCQHAPPPRRVGRTLA